MELPFTKMEKMIRKACVEEKDPELGIWSIWVWDV